MKPGRFAISESARFHGPFHWLSAGTERKLYFEEIVTQQTVEDLCREPPD
jgi:hypothetical protein